MNEWICAVMLHQKAPQFHFDAILICCLIQCTFWMIEKNWCLPFPHELAYYRDSNQFWSESFTMVFPKKFDRLGLGYVIFQNKILVHITLKTKVLILYWGLFFLSIPILGILKDLRVVLISDKNTMKRILTFQR